MTMVRWIAGAALLLSAAIGQARDFKTVGNDPVILYDTPSLNGAKLFVAPRGMPLQVMLTDGAWFKVRDVSGDLAWTEARGLSDQHNVIVHTPNLKVHATADEKSSVSFIVEKGTLLTASESVSAGWTRVQHKDGLSGYVKNADIWGN
jgi:SH3-like domain-containing protein